MEGGALIAFEGIDGSGLSTQASRVRETIENRSYLFREDGENDRDGDRSEPITHLTKEPTDGPVGGEIREALSGRLKIDAETLALMFAADRRDHIEQTLKPMMKRGKIVLVDRYYLSSLAYQGVEVDDLDWLMDINSKVIIPDLTFFIDVKADEAQVRIEEDRLTKEVYEEMEKQEAVRKKYIEVGKKLSDEHDIRTIDGEMKEEKVERQIMKNIHDKIGGSEQHTLNREF